VPAPRNAPLFKLLKVNFEFTTQFSSIALIYQNSGRLKKMYQILTEEEAQKGFERFKKK